MAATFSCDRCHHLFAADCQDRTLTLADAPQALQWYWSGRRWRGRQYRSQALRWDYLLVGAILIAVPTALIGGAGYLFPPASGGPLAWLPGVWSALALVAHSLLVGCLLLAYYQIPVLMRARALIDSAGSRSR
jgi:hypothetical protein